MTARLMLVDDDPLVRSGLRLLLGGSSAFDVVAEAGNGREAVDLHRADPVDVVLMDLRMPVMDGIEATALLKREPPAPAVLVLTTFDADDYVVRALAVGADGFLLKDTPPGGIVAAIERVLAGDPALSPSVTAALIKQVVHGHSDGPGADGRAAPAQQAVETLTPRERDVAISLARGASNAEIAAELYLSVPTVKAHISRIFTKLDATNRVQVAIAMHDAGLV
ncbi:response regulator transcription factor [Tsukamurella sp. 8F]|uniref:response regulator n=1 Tax=unclassified Tsukamurella TaxID=2633480 RepID=UPI0023B9DC27|nr:MULTISPECIES: response regulator transcription factor [unclassified Tsukamurella]MDF0530758.1 response regulator transcription factor [Tsukamurella sp. 8J]MDF0587959.1 response regulator transcription factor [Tsukamurella sp. 8F]